MVTTTRKTKKELIEELEALQQRVTKLEQSEVKRKRIEAELRARALQQAVVAELGQHVLAGIDLPTLLNEAVTLVAQALKVEFCQILELLPDRDLLYLRAGIGWDKKLVGQATIDARPNSQIGYTLFSSEPVIVEDLSKDRRFSASPLLEQHNIVSGVSVIVDGAKWPFGVLSIHTAKRRLFTRDDINILQAVANVLASAVEHNRAQVALQEAYDQLEIRVKERTAELETANEELRTFAYIVSHDLRAPLVNIKGFLGELTYTLDEVKSIIEPNLPELEPQQQQSINQAFAEDIPESMNFIDSSVTRMDRLVNAILKLSRLGRRELYLETVNMNALTASVLGSLAHQIEQQGAAVHIDTLPSVVADQTSMEQIVANILNNAVVYLDPDRAGKIKVTGHRNYYETIFQISDNGRGIAQEDQHKVFELFRRAGRQDVPGEGMGLAYVRTMIRRHGGRIWFDSEPNVGTTFTFTIPNNINQGDIHANNRSGNYSIGRRRSRTRPSY